MRGVCTSLRMKAKEYDRAYFDRWYRNPRHRVKSEAELRRKVAMIVALAASTAFMTPVSSPVNTLVVTPGNYTFGDFVKLGVPFSIIVRVVSVLLVPILLPL